ncbi:hypothetical protein DICPUDRAFT_12561, partial [Dictyostelium purpureum]
SNNSKTTNISNDQPDLSPALYISGLEWWTKDQELEKIFSEFGKIVTLKIFENENNGKSKGYAFIEFQNQDSAQQAKSKLDRKSINGKEM